MNNISVGDNVNADDQFHDVIQEGVAHGGVEARKAIATYGYLHDELKDDPSEEVRECVAHESTNTSILHYLSADSSEKVKIAAMLNPMHGQGTLF